MHILILIATDKEKEGEVKGHTVRYNEGKNVHSMYSPILISEYNSGVVLCHQSLACPSAIILPRTALCLPFEEGPRQQPVPTSSFLVVIVY